MFIFYAMEIRTVINFANQDYSALTYQTPSNPQHKIKKTVKEEYDFLSIRIKRIT
jgi:hypothetical protein